MIEEDRRSAEEIEKIIGFETRLMLALKKFEEEFKSTPYEELPDEVPPDLLNRMVNQFRKEDREGVEKAVKERYSDYKMRMDPHQLSR